ncbi:MAG: C2H2-type zinc finger protein [Chloroflexota bacterium]|jgi:hypothetical protein|nr:C2H2-type zinc finger protein [Candidatus Sulfotelmatobacter sp.]
MDNILNSGMLALKTVLPLLSLPGPSPNTPLPKVPIPGEVGVAGEREAFKCKTCGAIFNSKEELDLHMKTDHPNNKE